MSFSLFACLLLALFYLTTDAAAARLFNFTQCAIDVNASFTNVFNSSFLVDSSGTFTDNPYNAWGITYAQCMNLCGSGWAQFDWYFFSTSFASWVLPSLALTAQLPYETKASSTNGLSLLLALGSPLLITYSLSLTVLNSRWLNLRFRTLRDRNEEVLGKQINTLEAARVFLRESQHIPLEVRGPRSEIAQLIVSPTNRPWWDSLRKEVLKSKREWTYSLLAQVIMAGIGAISAVSNFFAAAVDDTDLGIGIAVNSLWIWMIPVTLGFVWVGTQRSANAVREALMSSEACLSEKGASQVHKEARLIKNRMIGFRDRTGDESMCVQSDIEAGKSLGERPPPASMLGISHAGFELEPGPIFNYARIWSYRNTAQAVIDAFAVLNARLESKQPVRETEKGWNCDPHQWKDNLEGSPEEMEAYIYPPGYQEVSCGNYSMTWHCILAAFVGVVLQWGTTGAAILTAYNTPVVGLGCESGSYLLYGTLATFSWALLVLSAYLSHKYTSSIRTSVLPRAMGRNASAASAISSIELQSLLPAQTTVTGPSPTDAQHLPSRQTTPFLPALIILTRFSGLLLAILNAFWLLLISTLQFTNLYDNCWCEGCVLGLGSKAWVILWASDAQIVAAAQESWIFAVAMSAVAVVFAGGFFIVMRGEEVLRKQ